jgi:uncharacterized Zn finger protein
MDNLICDKCGAKMVAQGYQIVNGERTYRRYRCTECGHTSKNPLRKKDVEVINRILNKVIGEQ